jgi:hypothetical protein
MAANPESRQSRRVWNWIPGSRATRVPRNDAEVHCCRRRCRGNLVSSSRSRAGRLSVPPGPSRRRLRGRRADRHPGPLHRRQARQPARPARHRREQDRRGRHARDTRRACAAGGRLQPPALHALRVDQHGALQESGLQAVGPRAGIGYRQILLRPRALEFGTGEYDRRADGLRQDSAWRSELRHARRGIGPGDHGAAVREARRHLDEPRPVPHRFAGHAGPDRRPGAFLRLANHRRRAAVPGQAAQDCRSDEPAAAEGAARHPDAEGEGHRLRALRFPRHLRARGHAAGHRQSAQPPHRLGRGDAGVP